MKKTFSLPAVLLAVLLVTGCETENADMKIDEIFSEFDNSTPGAAVAVFKDSKKVFSKGYGLADLESNTPIDEKTNFRLASITKQFTAASILLLEKEGLLNLNDKLTDIFADFPKYGKDITIKQILQHTSGLLAYEDYIDDTITIQLLDNDVLDILKERDSTYFEPGTQHRYSNSGYAVLALIVEKLSGKTFPEFLEERIFKPAGMTNTVAYINGVNNVPHRAYGYYYSEDGLEFSDQSVTSAVLGDGGIYSSINDMQKWDKALNEASILNEDYLTASWTKGMASDTTFDYGYGWRLIEYAGKRLDYHTGSTCGFSNVYMRFPDENLSILVLMNLRDYPALDYGQKVADIFLK